VVTILLYGDEKIDDLLVFSQVVLSLQLGFAIIPLIHFVSDKAAMGEFAIKTYVKIAAWAVAVVLVYLNVQLVADESMEIFRSDAAWYWKALLTAAILVFIWLFLMMTFLPLVKRYRKKHPHTLHGDALELKNLQVAPVNRIAISLDFSKSDEKLIAYAIAQGKETVSYVLLHVVESVAASYSGEASDDDETREDRGRLESYVAQLQQMGYRAEFRLGYKNRVKEIVRMVRESGADMLVMGAHRHSGLKDYVFGETIEAVRHALPIPVLIVSKQE
jgi:manganese transport protein